MLQSTRSGRQLFWVVQRAAARAHQRQLNRSYMDVHQRPSHSQMFVAKPPPPPTNDEPFHLMRIAMALGIVYGFGEYVAELTLCEGPSMSPTLQPSGDVVLVDKLSYRYYGMEASGEARTALALQRQGGDDDIWHQDRVPVDQTPPQSWWQLFRSPLSVGDVIVLNHPQRPGTVCKRVLGLPGDYNVDERWTIPDGHVWVEGDNPANSADSRSYGPVPMNLILGRVLCRVWPLGGGSMVLQRGWRPQPAIVSNDPAVSGSVIFPAGYSGQTVMTTWEQVEAYEKKKRKR